MWFNAVKNHAEVTLECPQPVIYSAQEHGQEWGSECTMAEGH